tara:strand:- start:119 stop:580 length:462 start_codon:yes stop_codon:yes gene_type:complete
MDKTLTGQELAEMDFNYITDWIDAKLLKIDIELWQRVSIFHNPDVFKSLAEQEEQSPYHGKDIYDCLVIYKRLRGNISEQKKLDEKMSNPCDMKKQTMRTKKLRLKRSLRQKLFISDELAIMHIDDAILKLGTCMFNHTVKNMVNMIVNYKGL